MRAEFEKSLTIDGTSDMDSPPISPQKPIRTSRNPVGTHTHTLIGNFTDIRPSCSLLHTNCFYFAVVCANSVRSRKIDMYPLGDGINPNFGHQICTKFCPNRTLSEVRSNLSKLRTDRGSDILQNPIATKVAPCQRVEWKFRKTLTKNVKTLVTLHNIETSGFILGSDKFCPNFGEVFVRVANAHLSVAMLSFPVCLCLSVQSISL